MTRHRDMNPQVAHENDAERKKIIAAMRRLLITAKPRAVTLEGQVEGLKKKNRDLQTCTTHWEGAARDLARTVAALQMLYDTASARLDAIIADVALDDSAPRPGAKVSPIVGRRRK